MYQKSITRFQIPATHRLAASHPALGEFVDGYTDEPKKINFPALIILLIGLIFFFPALMGLPDMGNLLVMGFVLVIIGAISWMKHAEKARLRILIYKGGFVAQELSNSGAVERSTEYPFDKIEGMTHYGYAVYNSAYRYTEAKLMVYLSSDHEVELLNYRYRNKDEEEWARDTFGEFASRALLNAWYPISYARVDEQMKAQGYAVFFDGNRIKVEVGTDFIRVGEQTFSCPITVSKDERTICLYSRERKGSAKIDYGRMYNGAAFVNALNRLTYTDN